jgi:lysylphosphatidylglycerol synthetase-like protein (DUF2156 family)
MTYKTININKVVNCTKGAMTLNIMARIMMTSLIVAILINMRWQSSLQHSTEQYLMLSIVMLSGTLIVAYTVYHKINMLTGVILSVVMLRFYETSYNAFPFSNWQRQTLGPCQVGILEGATTLSITTFNITTLPVTIQNVTLSITSYCIWGLYHKTYYGRNLRISVLS